MRTPNDRGRAGKRQTATVLFLDATTAVAHRECSMTITPLVDEGAGLMHWNRQQDKILLEEISVSLSYL